ncbi:MAG: AraC family transcriptional regulator [Bacteroidetes bacterium]|nr:AraC family transcriptional regulator [Bacteroidota bacterium]
MNIRVTHVGNKKVLYEATLPSPGAAAKPLRDQGMAGLTCTALQFAGAELLYVRWNTSGELSLQVHAAPGVYLCLNLEGKALLAEKPRKWKEEMIPQQCLLMSRGAEALALTAKGLRQSICIIRFSPEAFLKLSEDASESLTMFRKLVKRKKAGSFSAAPQFISLSMHNALNDMAGCSYTGSLKEMYLKAKATELMALLAASAEKSLPQQSVIKNEYDRERILFARDYLLQHMEHPPSLPQLAIISGINEFKLKRGFKEIFDHTIYGYLSDAKLELAKGALDQRNKTVGEIAFELGYSSIQHFSKAFRKKYGLPPTAFK